MVLYSTEIVFRCSPPNLVSNTAGGSKNYSPQQYRATPHNTAGKSPSELPNARKLKSTFPWVQFNQTFPEIRETDAKRKEKIKEYADKCSHAESADLNAGDKVLVKQPKRNKMSTSFNPEPFEIKKKKGSMIA